MPASRWEKYNSELSTLLMTASPPCLSCCRNRLPYPLLRRPDTSLLTHGSRVTWRMYIQHDIYVYNTPILHAGVLQMGTILRLLVIFAGLLTASISQATSPTVWSPLMEVTALSDMLDDHIRIIHVTGDYAEGHIPGAVHTPYASFRGPPESPGQLPPLSDLTRIVQTAGITADTPVIVVHQGSNPADMGAATRVYWTLKSLGINDVAVLNGGFTGWRDAGLPTSTTAPTVEASTFEPQWSDTWQIHADEIHQSLGTDAL